MVSCGCRTQVRLPWAGLVGLHLALELCNSWQECQLQLEVRQFSVRGVTWNDTITLYHTMTGVRILYGALRQFCNAAGHDLQQLLDCVSLHVAGTV